MIYSLIFSLLFILLGCGEYGLEEGQITKGKYEVTKGQELRAEKLSMKAFEDAIIANASLPAPVKILSSTATNPISGILYDISGSHSLYGDYTGQAIVYGKNEVQRLIKFETYKHLDHFVESIWTGTNSGNAFTFPLKLSYTMTSIDDYAPSAADFSSPIVVKGTLDQKSSITFDVKGEGTYTETWVKNGTTSQLLWENLRVATSGVGHQSSLVEFAFDISGVSEVIKRYHSIPFVASYKNRAEYKEKNQYFITDKSDAIFYEKNQNTLRVATKTINPLSLAEAVLRKNAYGKKLSEKADFFSKQVLKYSLNPAGFLEHGFTDKKGNKIGARPEYDSALWSSMFAWAEAERYKVTGDPEALENFKKVVEGLLLLVDITGTSDQFARGVIVSHPSEDQGAWVQGLGKFDKYKWLPGGNNDMCKSFFITLSLAHSTLPASEVGLRERITAFATKKLVKIKVIKDDAGNLALAKGVAAIWSGQGGDFDAFYHGVVNFTNYVAKVFGVDTGIYHGGIADWSGVNLTMTSNLAQILISDELLKVFPKKSDKIKKSRQYAENRLLGMNETHKRSQRHFLSIFTYAYSPKARADFKFFTVAREATWALKEIPAPRKHKNAAADLALHPHWCVSYWPVLPWKGLKGFRKYEPMSEIEKLTSGVYHYPFFEGESWSSSYLWKEKPFKYIFTTNESEIDYPMDYLLAYWVGRSSGLISSAE